MILGEPLFVCPKQRRYERRVHWWRFDPELGTDASGGS